MKNPLEMVLVLGVFFFIVVPLGKFLFGLIFSGAKTCEREPTPQELAEFASLKADLCQEFVPVQPGGSILTSAWIVLNPGPGSTGRDPSAQSANNLVGATIGGAVGGMAGAMMGGALGSALMPSTETNAGNGVASLGLLAVTNTHFHVIDLGEAKVSKAITASALSDVRTCLQIYREKKPGTLVQNAIRDTLVRSIRSYPRALVRAATDESERELNLTMPEGSLNLHIPVISGIHDQPTAMKILDTLAGA